MARTWRLCGHSHGSICHFAAFPRLSPEGGPARNEGESQIRPGEREGVFPRYEDKMTVPDKRGEEVASVRNSQNAFPKAD